MKRPSERGWEILAQFVQERAKQHGPDGDLADDEKVDELAAAADDARKILKDRSFQRLRLQGLGDIVQDFVAWLQLDPAGRMYQQELLGIHMRASGRYWELFRPEMVIAEAREKKKKQEKQEDLDEHIRKQG